MGLAQESLKGVERHHRERMQVHEEVDNVLGREGKRKEARVAINLANEFTAILTSEGSSQGVEDSWQEGLEARARENGGLPFRTYDKIGGDNGQDTEAGIKKFNDIVSDLNRLYKSKELTLEQVKKFIPSIKKLFRMDQFEYS